MIETPPKSLHVVLEQVKRLSPTNILHNNEIALFVVNNNQHREIAILMECSEVMNVVERVLGLPYVDETMSASPNARIKHAKKKSSHSWKGLSFWQLIEIVTFVNVMPRIDVNIRKILLRLWCHQLCVERSRCTNERATFMSLWLLEVLLMLNRAIDVR